MTEKHHQSVNVTDLTARSKQSKKLNVSPYESCSILVSTEDPKRHDRRLGSFCLFKGGFSMVRAKTKVTSIRVPPNLKVQIRDIAGSTLGAFLVTAAKEKLDRIQESRTLAA